MPNNKLSVPKYENKSPFKPLYKGTNIISPELKDHNKNVSENVNNKLTLSMNEALNNIEAQLSQDIQTLRATNNGYDAGSTVIDFQKNVLNTLKNESNDLESSLKMRDREILNTMNYADYQDKLVEYLQTYLIIIIIGTFLIMGGFFGGLISRYTMEFMMFLLIIGVALYFGYLSNQAYINKSPSAILATKIGTGIQKIESDVTLMGQYLQSEINKFNKNQCAIQHSRFRNL